MYGGFGFCTYITPCGYCSKFDKWCEKKCGKKDKENKVNGITINPTMNRIKSGLGLEPLNKN